LHGFTTRAGGVSAPPFDSLDFAILRNPEQQKENQRRLAAAVGFDVARLYQVRQVHGRNVVVAEGDPARMLEVEADAIVAEPGTGAAVAARVADCVSVLLADPKRGRVAAVHAGWPGVVARVVEAAVERIGTSDLLAATGPSIGPCCFEVDADVEQKIVGASDASIVVRREGVKAYLDLRRAVRIQLRALGMRDESIDDVPGCAKCDRDRFYSYRRDKDASGRQLGVIVPLT
jgi:YfiH family protein